MNCVPATTPAPVSDRPASPRCGFIEQGCGGSRRACRVSCLRPRRDPANSMPQGLDAGGRDNGGRRPARRLQPDLFRGVPDRSRRQQRRSGLHLIAHALIAKRTDVHGFHPQEYSARRRAPRTSGPRWPTSAPCIGAWCRASCSTRGSTDDARIVTFANGTVARELLVDCDHARRRLVYAVVSERIKQHSAAVQVVADGDSRAG